ncbi:MAG: hypothetical protein JWM98_1640 [Thermoleophilia bacterium]|nr:hypothetical protein [Thermoleophilia bacterium]
MSSAAPSPTPEPAQEREVVRFQRRLPHNVAKVWAALATPGGLSAWLSADVQFEALVSGATLRLANGPGGTREGRVVEVDPLNLLHLVWADGSETMLRLRHDADGLETLLAFAHAAPAAARRAAPGSLAAARDGAWRMPSRHGLVAYTTNERGDRVYLTQERWLHIRENHMDTAPTPRGKRTTTYWPTSHAVEGPTMTDQQVIGVIVDAARKGTLRTEVRDTRMAEYDLPTEQRAAFGVSEAKVSMAPDGLVLSAYPGAGDNVLAVYEMSEADQAELVRATAQARAQNPAVEGDDRMFRTKVAATTFG